MKVGFTGTQQGMSAVQKALLHDFFATHTVEEFHHGDCIGADEEAHQIAIAWCVPRIVIHPPVNPAKRAQCATKYDCSHSKVEVLPTEDYLVRNKQIVDETEFLVVAPQGPEVLRSGTWSTKRYAQKRKKPFQILTRSHE